MAIKGFGPVSEYTTNIEVNGTQQDSFTQTADATYNVSASANVTTDVASTANSGGQNDADTFNPNLSPTYSNIVERRVYIGCDANDNGVSVNGTMTITDGDGSTHSISFASGDCYEYTDTKNDSIDTIELNDLNSNMGAYRVVSVIVSHDGGTVSVSGVTQS